MSNVIRRQSIITTAIIFFGFGIGFINNLFFTSSHYFQPDEYGLTRTLFDFSNLIYAFTFLGGTAIMYKFYPYYENNLKEEDNDLLSWMLVIPLIAFIIFLFVATAFKGFFIRKFSANSPQLITYYFWIFPFGFALLIYNLLDGYCNSIKRTVITNFLKETVLRILTLILILLFVFKIIDYPVFIKLFSLLYIVLVVILILYLHKQGKFHLSLKPSKLTRRLWKKMLPFAIFIFAGTLISTIAASFDSLIISSKLANAQAMVGIFTFSTYISNIIQVPQRSVIAISIPFLSEAWRKKDHQRIQTIYQRSSINLLLIALFLFGNIWLNYENAINTLHLNPVYLQGKYVVLLMGIKILVDMGTGVNGQIIGTSNYWKVEFFTGIFLLLLLIPMNFILVPRIGITGAAISSLAAYTCYNIVRLGFLWYKFRMQPFSTKTLVVLALGVIAYLVVFYLTPGLSGWLSIFIKSAFFSLLFVVATWYLKLTPDFEPILNTVKKRFGIKGKA
ncbi:MAG: polysaccharide biosynthesis protein [Sphingobacteriales bacterium]|nr:polysaccharide biosynthesis protein [Sphingobacteriales bacterium]